ncbi:MAG: hypothetical protein C4K58_05070 [Flavobacteriaceae bacterium]|nr:MAG: hypothetical protein C4K58_05070 [Flavobacteriaceae bacterium]
MTKHNQQTNSAEELIDNLNQGVSTWEKILEKYSKLILGGVLLVVLGVMAMFYFKNQKEKNNQEAISKLYPAEEAFSKGEFDKALNGEKGVTDGFNKIASEYAGTKAADKATYSQSLALLPR